MNSEIKNILTKVEKIERQLKDITQLTDKFGSNSYETKYRDFLNFSCIEEEKLKLSTLKMNKQESILMECLVEFSSATSQEVEMSLMMGDLVMSKIKKKAEIGINTFSLVADYLATLSSEIDVYLIVKPVEMKQIILQGCTCNIWGVESESSVVKYDVVEIENNYLISFIKDECVYYKIITKQEVSLGDIDLDFCVRAKDYSFVYDEKLRVLKLCRIDLDGNLIIDDLSNNKSTYIDSGVSSVSASSSNDRIVVGYVKNGECFVIEYEGDNCFSKSKLGYEYIINKCDLFYNKNDANFYMILNVGSGKNILIKSAFNESTLGENIKANYKIEVEVYEV